ncbi:hypothetical protein LUZ60_017767 [Juncus effusus]|nr:hypothetical protein LUZ60_017767 [Juncus effusus]
MTKCMMSYTVTKSVTKSSPMLVPPASSTPSGVLSLSTLDRNTHLFMDFVSIFPHGKEPTVRIKEAFSKALVQYYPVAGRITRKDDELVVDCTGHGIWYVEATANCSLADVNYFTDVNYFDEPHTISKKDMMPIPPADVKHEEQTMMAQGQVTEFSCGGFSVGIWFNHIMFDGLGLGQFLKAVGEMSCGLSETTMKPAWSREAIRFPPEVPHSWPRTISPVFNFPSLVVDISLDSINRTKDLFFNETGQKCTVFEVSIAMIYKTRTKVINLAPNEEVKIMFAASTRRLLPDVLPSVEGYYGNCFYIGETTKTSEEINNASIVEVITFIKEAKDNVPTKFMDWVNRKPTKNVNMPSLYSMFYITDWRRIGFEVDYGWGEPKYVFTHNLGLKVPGYAIYLNPPAPKEGIRMLLECVKEEHVAEFRNELQKLNAEV